MEAELSVCNVELPLLKCCLERLLALFDCLSQIEDDNEGTLTLRLWTHHKTDDSLRNAQEYLLSVISENPASEQSYSFAPTDCPRVGHLFALRSDLEREARVVVRFSDSEVVARGPLANVQRAMQLVEEFLLSATTSGGQIFRTAGTAVGLKTSVTADSLLSEAGSGPGGLPPMMTTAIAGGGGYAPRRDGRGMTRRVESEDSSYDSDTEGGFAAAAAAAAVVVASATPGARSQAAMLGQATLTGNNTAAVGCGVTSANVPSVGAAAAAAASSAGHNKHDDVSRTVSDTLGAEFAEYISTQKVGLQAVLADPSYQSRLEFALKLGYTEAQVQTALQRLGLSAANNELLAELIKLSSSVSLRDDDQGSVSTTPCGGGPQSAVGQGAPTGAAPSAMVTVTGGSGGGGVGSGASLVTVSDAANHRAAGGELRPIVIDGSNVAMSHGNKDVFSCRGIRLCVDWFRSRGHTDVTVFVPSWRKEAARPNTPIADQDILLQLERDKVLVFTPSRNVGGKRLVCYEDRYVLKLAAETDGIVVSNDNYRDLVVENADFKRVVEERLLMYSFVNDRFMPPDDPLGRQGPTLDQFLRKPNAAAAAAGGAGASQQSVPPICPYAKKCTYGNKCKYYHPERGNMPQKSITERLAEQCKIQLQEVKARGHHFAGSSELTRTRSVPVTSAGDLSLPAVGGGGGGAKKKQPLSRTRSAAPPQRPQAHDDFSCPSMATGGAGAGGPRGRPHDDFANIFHGGDGSMPLWRHSSWSNLPLPGKTTSLLSESGHLSLAKKLSDPAETHHGDFVGNSLSPTGGLGSSGGCSASAGGPGGRLGGGAIGNSAMNSACSGASASTSNLHKKLHRQLTLNPSCDDRLAQMRMANRSSSQTSPSGPGTPGGGASPPHLHQQQHHHHSVAQRIHSDGPVAPSAFRTAPAATSSSDLGPSGLTMFGGVDGGWQSSNSSSGSVGGGSSTGAIGSGGSCSSSSNNNSGSSLLSGQHNSTSDTRLNMFPNQFVTPTCYQANIWASPLAPAQQRAVHTAVRPSSVPPPQNRMRAPLMVAPGAAGVPPPPATTTAPFGGGSSASGSTGTMVTTGGLGSGPLPALAASSNSSGGDFEGRNKLYFHLSSIFSEEQVRAAMDMQPDERNPQKICAMILAMFPPKP